MAPAANGPRVAFLAVSPSNLSTLRKLEVPAGLSTEDVGNAGTAVVLFGGPTPDANRLAAAGQLHSAGRTVKLASLVTISAALNARGFSKGTLLDAVDELPAWTPPETAPADEPEAARQPVALDAAPQSETLALVRRSLPLNAPVSRGSGFLKLPRNLFLEPALTDLRADQRFVVVTLLQLAAFQPFIITRPEAPPISVPRGAVAHSLDVIASEAVTTKKVARSLVDKLLSRGWLLDIGRGLGLAKTSPRLLLIASFDAYMAAGAEAVATLRREPEADERETRVGARQALAELAAVTGKPVSDLLREHSATPQGKQMSSASSLDRAGIAWVEVTRDRLLTALDEARQRATKAQQPRAELPWERAERRAREEQQP